VTDISAGERVWGGRTLDDRRAARRAQLVEAALDLLAAGGAAAVTVRSVCRTAKLTERYFYETFTDRDDLVTQVFDEVTTEALDAITAAIGGIAKPHDVARAAVDAVVGLSFDDPRKGNVLFVASMTDERLYRRRDELMPVVTGLIRQQVPSATDDAHRDLVAIGLLGALGNLFFQYFSGSLDISRQAFVDHCVRLLMHSAVMPAG
jgi:AcrR family transcriptional regulator